MNNLINLQHKELTMSSREIAGLTDKLHKNVLADIKNMLEALEIQSADFSADYKDSRGRTYQEYLLPKKYIECLLTGYSIPLRMKVIDRLHELESKTQIMVPQTLPEALRLAAELAEEKELLKIEVNELKPKAEFHDIAVDTHGALPVGQAAKSLGTGRNRLLQWMRQHKWINRRNEPYQDKIEQGLLDVKLSNWEHPERGIQEVITTLVTGKGLAKLSQMLNERIAA